MSEKNEPSTIVERRRGGAGTGGGAGAGPSQREKDALPQPERVTVNLTPRSVRAMNNLASWTDYTKTDTINRALQVYEFVQQIIENGGSVHVRRTEDAEPERLALF